MSPRRMRRLRVPDLGRFDFTTAGGIVVDERKTFGRSRLRTLRDLLS